MPNAAILIGNSEYRNATRLQCCRADVLAVEELLIATDKYEKITKIENVDADELKERLRAALDAVKSPEELFFYFTGHGFLHETEFFLCAKNFDPKRPNETGLSETELHTHLRLPDAKLVISVLDACNSGTLLIKSNNAWFTQQPKGFRNIIQFASCLDSQSSLTGDPLSVFTEKFRAAALRKTEGVVYYTDIVNTLRDEFLDNNAQTPLFISQHTGREQFIDEAKKLDELRQHLEAQNIAHAVVPTTTAPPTPAVSLLDRLRAVEAKVVTPEAMEKYVGGFFDNLKNDFATNDFADFFILEIADHPRFEEDITEQFIIRVLNNEKRPDNFVTAHHLRKKRLQNPLYYGGMYSTMMQRYIDEDPYVDDYELRLNCTMTQAQMKITVHAEVHVNTATDVSDHLRTKP